MAIHTAANGWTYTDEQWFKYFNMDDDTLRRTYNDAAAPLLTTMNMGISEKADRQAIAGAIDSIWAEKKRREATKDERDKAYHDMINKAYLNLKAAHTANGQLVASILEDEDGKTAEELKAWCDELMSLDDAEYQQLLADLIEDGVLYKEEIHYHLLRDCASDLSFCSRKTKAAWARFIAAKTENKNAKWGDRPKWFTEKIAAVFIWACSTRPFYPEVIINDSSRRRMKLSERRTNIVPELNDFVAEGILIKEETGVFAGCYRIPLLGEKR